MATIAQKAEKATQIILNNKQIWKLMGTIGLITVMTRLFVDSFRNDVYEPFTDYVFPHLFETWIISNPGKRDIKIGLFLRKIIIWFLLAFLIVFLF
jgi:hypothetical protein